MVMNDAVNMLNGNEISKFYTGKTNLSLRKN